ncbi:MAG: A/G-specific adenine glycosylase [Flavobacteriaceae bacterium]|nr:A/G-specific adenine glycosylase [Flavobacteriaceae bacterium]
MKNKYFTTKIVKWYILNKRNLPWRVSKLPYRIWLSEIILQQTKVDQGLPYYNRFVEAYPEVEDLAGASEEEVLKNWQGLGYYSRARNLHATAKYVHEELGGEFPNTYKGLLLLKGVGDYTASAIASFCFGEPQAVLDGNVFRVLGRYFGVDHPQNTTAGRKIFKELAMQMLDEGDSATYNQAIMEFGALQCKPKNPNCAVCVLSDSCFSFSKGVVAQYPLKQKKKKPKKAYFEYIVVQDSEGQYWFEARRGKGIWEGLYEFPLLQFEQTPSREHLLECIKEEYPWDIDIASFVTLVEAPVVHKLTHKTLICRFWKLQLHNRLAGGKSLDVIKKLPTSVLIAKFIEQQLN